MTEQLLWSIGSLDGHSEQLFDNYKEPLLAEDLVYDVSSREEQRWPLFHPSEADPDAGYKHHPYKVLFPIDEKTNKDYVLRIKYLVIAPRMSYLEVKVNGLSGVAYLRPIPSTSGNIALYAGLHTSIYSEGTVEIIIPSKCLVEGENTIELISHDGKDVICIDNMERIKRLDRMANGAGFIYQYISFSAIEKKEDKISKVEIKPTVLYTKQKDGELVERCDLYLELNGSISDATISCQLIMDNEQKEIISFQLPETTFGHLYFPFSLKDGEGEVFYKVYGEINGSSFEKSGFLKRSRKWKVYVTPHSHTDIGYTHRQWEVAERMCRTIDTAIDYLNREESATSSFAYHIDASWVLENYLATRSEEQIKQLFYYIKIGKIGIPHSYVDLLTQFASLEDLIRNGEYSEKILKTIHKKATFTTVVDVPSLTSSLPIIYEGSGVKYLVHANNQDRGPFRLNGQLHKISPFYWEGKKGGKVLVWLAKMYCELRKVCGSPPLNSAAECGLQLWLDEYENDDYTPDAVLLYGQEADNTDIDYQPIEFVKEWNNTYVYPKLVPSNVSDFFEYIEEHFGHSLKKVKGDGGAYWEDGIGSTILPAIESRQAQSMLPAAECLESLAVMHNDELSYPLHHYDYAWSQNLQFVEHTWGAFLSGTDPDAIIQKDMWSVKEHFAKEALQWSNRLLHGAAVKHSLQWNNNGREVIVYNPHSWEVSDSVMVEIGVHEEAVDAETGEKIPTRLLQKTASQALVELWIHPMPGFSYRRMKLVNKEHTNSSPLITQEKQKIIKLETEYYCLVFDAENGIITSLYDKECEKELVDRKDPWGFGQILYAKGGEGTRLISNQADLPNSSLDILTDVEWKDSRIEHFSFGVSLIVRGQADYGEIEIEWKLLNDAKRIDVQFKYLKEEIIEKEAVYVAFPLHIDEAEILSDSQLGWINWDKEELPGGCKEWLPLQTGILAKGADFDVFIASPDIPLFCVGDIVRGSWPKERKLTGNRIFSYVLNNYWMTNYKASQGGEFIFRYSITSNKNIAYDEAFRIGNTRRLPLYSHRMSFQDFRKPKKLYNQSSQVRLAEIGGETIVCSTLKKARYQDGWIVRLQEVSGTNGKTTLSIPGKRIIKAWETDLLEREQARIFSIKEGRLTIEIPAWGLKTIRFLIE